MVGHLLQSSDMARLRRQNRVLRRLIELYLVCFKVLALLLLDALALRLDGVPF